MSAVSCSLKLFLRAGCWIEMDFRGSAIRPVHRLQKKKKKSIEGKSCSQLLLLLLIKQPEWTRLQVNLGRPGLGWMTVTATWMCLMSFFFFPILFLLHKKWAGEPVLDHLKHQILPLFNLDCLWCLLEHTPAAGAGSWLESGTFTRWWVMETNARRGGRGSGGQDRIIGFHLRLRPSLSRLCQKNHTLRETAIIKTENRL